MPDEFISLAAVLRGGCTAPCAPAPLHAADGVAAAGVAVDAPLPNDRSGAGPTALAERVVRDLAAMRAAALEAFEASVEELLRGLADEVLARELAFAPADVGALVTRALAAFAAHEPVAVVLCATNAELLHGVALPLRVDSSLGDGDVVIEVRGGKLESPLVFRLQTILERALGYEAA